MYIVTKCSLTLTARGSTLDGNRVCRGDIPMSKVEARTVSVKIFIMNFKLKKKPLVSMVYKKIIQLFKC